MRSVVNPLVPAALFRPIWGDIVENKLNLDEIDATWNAQNYIDGLAAYYLGPKTPSSRG